MVRSLTWTAGTTLLLLVGGSCVFGPRIQASLAKKWCERTVHAIEARTPWPVKPSKVDRNGIMELDDVPWWFRNRGPFEIRDGGDHFVFRFGRDPEDIKRSGWHYNTRTRAWTRVGGMAPS